MVHSAVLLHQYYLIIALPADGRVVLLPDNEAWRLPMFQSEEPHFWQDVAHVNRAAEEMLGGAMLTLRCVALDYRPEADTEVLAKSYALSPRDPGWSPPQGAYLLSAAELDTMALPEDQRNLLREWFAWVDRPAPPQRPRWYWPGWFEQATSWAREQLQQAQMPLHAAFIQLRTWQRSLIGRSDTAQGSVYLKVVPPLFAHEPGLNVVLAQIMPGCVPPIIAVDPQHGFLLMREQTGIALNHLREVQPWRAAVRTVAQIQIACLDHGARLRAIGLPQRPFATLPQRAQVLLADPALTLPHEPAGLNDAQRVRLAELLPHLEAKCAELAAYAVPETLDHGDFWAGQVLVDQDRAIVLDWSDSSLAHPFFSLLLLLLEIDDYFPKEPGLREQLRDAYLEPWRERLPGVDLVRAFEAAQPLAALHYALGYYEAVLPQMEQRWEMELMVPFYLKMFLRLAHW